MKVHILRHEEGPVGRVILTLDPDEAAMRAASLPGSTLTSVDARQLRSMMPKFVDVESQLERLLLNLSPSRSAGARALLNSPREQRRGRLAALVSALPDIVRSDGVR